MTKAKGGTVVRNPERNPALGGLLFVVECVPFMVPYHVIYKSIGETPLEAVERFRAERGIGKGVPMTYAGRLDPMAEGEMIVLVGDECRQKERYLGVDKEYEIEVLFGIETDTYDGLGLAKVSSREYGAILNDLDSRRKDGENLAETEMERFQQKVEECLRRYTGKLTQEYPPYSSKAVGGKQLHQLAREGALPEEMPTKQVEIYAIDSLGWQNIAPRDLLKRIKDAISRIKGDFRQGEVSGRWDEVLGRIEASGRVFPVLTLRVRCSSGTYMRSLAHRMGKDFGIGAFALSIKRIRHFLPARG